MMSHVHTERLTTYWKGETTLPSFSMKTRCSVVSTFPRWFQDERTERVGRLGSAVSPCAREGCSRR